MGSIVAKASYGLDGREHHGRPQRGLAPHIAEATKPWYTDLFNFYLNFIVKKHFERAKTLRYAIS